MSLSRRKRFIAHWLWRNATWLTCVSVFTGRSVHVHAKLLYELLSILKHTRLSFSIVPVSCTWLRNDLVPSIEVAFNKNFLIIYQLHFSWKSTKVNNNLKIRFVLVLFPWFYMNKIKIIHLSHFDCLEIWKK